MKAVETGCRRTCMKVVYDNFLGGICTLFLVVSVKFA